MANRRGYGRPKHLLLCLDGLTNSNRLLTSWNLDRLTARFYPCSVDSIPVQLKERVLGNFSIRWIPTSQISVGYSELNLLTPFLLFNITGNIF